MACCKEALYALEVGLIRKGLGGLFTRENLQQVVLQGNKHKTLWENLVSMFPFRASGPRNWEAIVSACPAESQALIKCRTDQCPQESAQAADACKRWGDTYSSRYDYDHPDKIECEKRWKNYQQCLDNFSI